MVFDIRFLSGSDESDPENCIVKGEMCIGEFREHFETSTEYWSKVDYERQWFEGVTRVVDESTDSCLITSLTDPKSANFIFWWPLYVENGLCVFQNQVLFLHELLVPFDESNPYRNVQPREQFAADGTPISEWILTFDDLQKWLKKIRA